MKKGTIVKMNDALKAELIKNDCKEHVDEFGECEGVVEDKMFPECDDCEEVNVRWKPTNLRYGYRPDQLEIIKDHYFKGYIKELNDTFLYVRLKRDYSLDMSLNIGLGVLTEIQISNLCLGRVFRYDEETGLIEMLLDDDSWVELVTIFETKE